MIDQTFRCTIHDIEFGAETKKPELENWMIECPYCMRDKAFNLNQELSKVRYHRYILLRAFEIKQMVEPVKITP